jgi:hypothetical protein
MAFEGIIGVLVLFNAPFMLFRSGRDGSPGLIIGSAIGTLIGIALVADAFRVRRHLNALDAKIEESEVGENSK